MKIQEICQTLRNIVCEEFEVTEDQITSNSRELRFTEARYVMFSILSKNTRYKQELIAEYATTPLKLNRSVVSYGVRKVEDWKDTDKLFERKYNNCKQKFIQEC